MKETKLHIFNYYLLLKGAVHNNFQQRNMSDSKELDFQMLTKSMVE